MNFFNSIKFKFTLWYLFILGSVLIILGSGIYLTLSKRLHLNLDRSLVTRVEQISAFRDILAIVAGGTFEQEPGELLSFYFHSRGQLFDISPQGQKVPVDTPWISRVIEGESGFTTISTEKDGNLRIFSVPYIPENTHVRFGNYSTNNRPPPKKHRAHQPGNRSTPHSDGGKPKPDRPPPSQPNEPEWPYNPDRKPDVLTIDKAALIVARSSKDMDIALAQLFQILVIGLPITLVLAGGGGILLLRIILNPVGKIIKTAQEIEEKDLSKRIEIQTKDELGDLAATLNLMIARLEKAFIRQKELTGDASHELRSPLAVIQAEASLALQRERDMPSYQKSLKIIVQESEHMAIIINQILTLARADSEKEQVPLQRLDLTALLTVLCEDIEILCQEKGHSLKLKQSGPAYIKGNKHLLRNLLHNLLQNAIHYTAANGAITISLSTVKERAIIAVSDSGIGIPQEELPHIFKRFYRVDKARSRESGGSGLGLAICKHIVKIHGGLLQVKSEVGRGSTFIVKLPLAWEVFRE